MRLGLRNILKTVEDGESYYQVVESDENYLNMKQHLFTLSELVEKSSDYNCDFSINNNVFQCNAMINTLEISKSLAKMIMEEECVEQRGNSLYSLLALGKQNDFLIVEDEIGDCVNGSNGIANFRNIAFSQSTMSIYVPMHQEDGFYNKMIVTQKEGTLTFKPFRFATPLNTAHIPECRRLEETVTVNGTCFQLWETGTLSVYDESVIIAECFINTAMGNIAFYKDIIAILNELVNGFAVSTNKQEWIGGSNSYQTIYGVYFKSSYQRIPKNRRKVLLDRLPEDVACFRGRKATKKELMDLYRSRNYSQKEAYVSLIIANVILNKDSVASILSSAIDAINQFKDKIFWQEMYTYRVRSYTFLSKKQLAPPNRPVMFGGNTKEYTQINSVFYY